MHAVLLWRNLTYIYAYLAACQLNLLTITETFLDNFMIRILPHLVMWSIIEIMIDIVGVMILDKNTVSAIPHDGLDLSCEVLWIELIFPWGGPVLFGISDIM